MFGWIILLIVALLTSIVIASVVLPRMYLKTRYALRKSNDRGIKKIIEKNGKSIVYEPELKWRKYIKQYLLSERGGKKQLLCKIDPEISYLAYDIAIFNNVDEVVEVIKVKERIENTEFTKVVDLPSQTSYVAITVTQVDAVDFSVPMDARVRVGKVWQFLLWCMLCLVMETFCVKVCFANIFGGVFREIAILESESILNTITILFILGLINSLVCIITLLIRRKKKSGWD